MQVDLPRWLRHPREREVPSIICWRLRLLRRLWNLSAYIFGCLTDAELQCLEVSLPGAADDYVASLTTAAWAATTSYNDAASLAAAAAWAANDAAGRAVGGASTTTTSYTNTATAVSAPP
jgi:hypothetical protein